jgi:hypothetical protein
MDAERSQLFTNLPAVYVRQAEVQYDHPELTLRAQGYGIPAITSDFDSVPFGV